MLLRNSRKQPKNICNIYVWRQFTDHIEAFRKVFDNIEEIIEVGSSLTGRKLMEGTKERSAPMAEAKLEENL